MAISPLALGIGLQGKYDYKRQTMLDLARERGRAKAEAAEEAGKEKKRAEVRKMISNIKPEGLLPFQQKIMDDGMADLLVYGADHQDDYPGMTQRTFELIAKNKAFKEQAEGYRRLSLQQGGMPVDAQALRVIGTLSDPKAIQEELVKFGDATSVGLTGDQLTLDNPKYEGLSTTFAKFVKDSMFDPQQEVKTFKIGERTYGGAEINTEVPKIMTATIMNTDNLKRSALNDYLGHAIEEKIPYDFSTLEGREEFKNNTTKWVNDNAQAYVDALSKQYGGSKTQFTTNLNTGERKGEEPVNFTEQTEIPIGKGKFIDYGGMPNQTDITLTLPNDGETYKLNNGEQVKKAEITKGVYNKVALGYVAKENYNFPATYITLQGGTKELIPAKKFTKGQPLVDRYAYAMAQKGKAKAGFVVFGQGVDNKGSEIELVRSYSSMGVSRFLNTTNRDRAYLDKYDANAVDARNRLQAKIDSYYQGNIEPTPTPPTPPKPKPKGGEQKEKEKPKDEEKKAKKDERASEVMKGIKPFEK
jgi:hypothetical protein